MFSTNCTNICRLALRRNNIGHLQKIKRVIPCRKYASNMAESDYSGRGQAEIVENVKPVTNVPFAKQLFLGKFEKDMLVFPEIESNDELNHLNAMADQLDKFFLEDVDSKAIDVNAKIPDETFQQMKDFGLFGMQVPEDYGGLGLNATAYARLTECISTDGAIAVTLAAHQAIGFKGILIAGTDAQKDKYLPKLASGEHIAAFCLTEPSSGSDAASIQTRATLSEDGKTYLLNGGKIWISNGGIADVFTVFAKTPVTNDMGETKDKVTAFIVERKFGGITNGRPEDKLGIRGSNTCEVHFENTPIPVENVLGQPGDGFKIAMNILNSGRFSMGAAGAGMLKKLIGWVSEHITTRSQFGKKLSEFGLIQEKLANVAMTTYVMESMAYMTAGQLDQYQNPDLAVEAAMVKVFASEGCWYSINEAMQMFGGMSYMKDYPYERYLRDARILLIFEGTNEILRLFIALNGVQTAGKELTDAVRKMRDPLNNLGFLMSKGISRMGKSPRLTMELKECVHPVLADPVEDLERNVLLFQRVIEDCLQRHGKDIIDQQLILKRLADIAIDLYACTAVISRASRSKSIGLRNCDHEVLMTQTFTWEANRRINQTIKDIQLNLTISHNQDEYKTRIAKTIAKNNGWAAEHPLARNW
ncbi:unnamed protein product [Owenia fusiformis]|uniref:Uncharacterized protein n=1 Tax=Owenia fusiformis TaxID=6347 RepID=A0A8J1T646_OWEFU|nr:unnamed protein product [Owenia fusiformis]